LSDLRLVGGTVVTLDEQQTLLAPGEVGLSGARIDYVGPVRHGADVSGEVLDTRGQAVLPGLVNAHTHVAMTLMRSYADDMPLHTWLEKRIWPIERHLTPEDVYWGTLLGAVEMIRGGVTTFHDMYWYAPEATRAGLEAGMRVCPSGVLIGIMPDSDAMLERATEFIDECLGRDEERLHVRYGPHAPYTVPDAYWAKIIERAAARNIPIHTHLAETEKEVADSLAQHGERVIEHMNRIGLFDVHCAAAHCVHLSRSEIELLAAKRVGVLASHTSNLKLGCGIAPIPDLLAAGAVVGLGTDGTASNNNLDVFGEIRLAALVHKGVRRDPTVISAQQALGMATVGGAEAVGISQLGRLVPGWRGDVICVDLTAAHLCPGHNVYSDLVYAAACQDVRHTIIGGRLVMKDRCVLTVDEAEVLTAARRCATALVARA
jgi:5-methylthioadenosine/S-adenosylhomocysteine deaminase